MTQVDMSLGQAHYCGACGHAPAPKKETKQTALTRFCATMAAASAENRQAELERLQNQLTRVEKQWQDLARRRAFLETLQDPDLEGT